MGPAAFWLLGYLLTNPEALAAVKTEMEALRLPPLDSSVSTPVLGEGFNQTLCWQRQQLCNRKFILLSTKMKYTENIENSIISRLQKSFKTPNDHWCKYITKQTFRNIKF